MIRPLSLSLSLATNKICNYNNSFDLFVSFLSTRSYTRNYTAIHMLYSHRYSYRY